LGENGAWAYPGTALIFWVPSIISGTGKATNFKSGRYIRRVHANKNPYKFGRKESVGVSRDFPNFLSTPIISVMGNATNFEFRRYIHRVYANKRPIEIWEKMERGRIQGLTKFFQYMYPILFHERVKLQTSNLADILTGSMRTNAH